MKFDVVIAGGGPAGMSLAAACAEAGLHVALLCGRETSWPANYGAWVATFDRLGLADYFDATWTHADVHFSDGNLRTLSRPYGRVAKGRLRSDLADRFTSAGGQLEAVRAVSVTHDDQGSTVVDDNGHAWCGSVAVDATGHRPVLLETTGEATLWQVAYGVEVTVKDHGLDPDHLVFMDYRKSPGEQSGPPTFLYGMPFGEHRVFLEETMLIGDRSVCFESLAERLQARLEERGWQIEHRGDEEFCVFPMNTPVPSLRQRVVGFGGAAGMVHPASGYLLPRVLEAAPRVATAIARGKARNLTPGQLSRAAWTQVWRRQDLVARVLFAYGAALVAEMERKELEAHFQVFFSIPQRMWSSYLDGSQLNDVMLAMISHFSQCSYRQRWKLATLGYGLPPAVCRQLWA